VFLLYERASVKTKRRKKCLKTAIPICAIAKKRKREEELIDRRETGDSETES
jgi:hypothetical protein